MYLNSYNYNLLKIPFIIGNIKLWIQKINLINNSMIITVFSGKEWIFVWVNNNILNEIESLKTLLEVKFFRKYINQKIWPANLWYWYVWVIKLKWNNNNNILNDYNYLKNIYKLIVNIK